MLPFVKNRWTRSAVVAILFLLTGKLGHLVAIPPGLATPVWLPSGITVAAFLLWGRQVWPGVFAGALLISALQTQGSSELGSLLWAAAVSVALASAVTLECLVTYGLYRRWGEDGPLLAKSRNVTALLLGAAPIGCIGAASLATLVLVGSGMVEWGRFGETWLTWMVGDLAGIYTLSPAILTLAAGGSVWMSRRDQVSATVAVLGLALVCGVTFFVPLEGYPPLAFLPAPLVIFVAYRFNDILASLVGPAVAGLALFATATGVGPFGKVPTNEALVVLQLFVTVGILTALLARALANERDTAEREAQRLSADLAHLSRVTMMGEIAAGMAHEYHQPLAAISNYASAIRIKLRGHEGAARDIGEALERISDEAIRAAGIVDHLKQFLQKREPERVPSDVNEIVADAVRLTRTAHSFPDIEIIHEPADGPPSANVDQIQITQILVNLLLNSCEAIQASGRSGGEVQVEVRERPGGWLRIVVSDNGPGMDAAAARSCFDQFYSTKQDGLGIGLGLSRTLAASHGGQLRLVATSEGGTTFCLELPLAESDETS